MTSLHFNNLEIAFLPLDYILSYTRQIPPAGHHTEVKADPNT